MTEPESYSEHFVPIRNRLRLLRETIEGDIPKVDQYALDMTFRQVLEMATGLDSALDAYKSAMQTLYRTARRSRPAGETEGTSYYQRRRGREENVARLAQESIEKQGYVITASIVSETGYRENTVEKVLEQVAEQQGWERRRDRETKSYRYSPKSGPDTAVSPSTQ
jgi:hypothetical protein